MKKNYSLIGEWVKRSGVSFLVSDGVCMDIKVEPNTEEVDFGDLYGITGELKWKSSQKMRQKKKKKSEKKIQITALLAG